MKRGGSSSPEEFWAREEALYTEIRQSFVRRGCYGLADWVGPVSIMGWSMGGSTSRSLLYGAVDSARQVQVLTTDEDPIPEIWKMRSSLEPGPKDRQEALQLHRRTDTQPDDQAEIVVGRERIVFQTWTFDDYFWAAGRVADQGIALQIRGNILPEIFLKEIRDIEPFLEGRRVLLERMRAEK